MTRSAPAWALAFLGEARVGRLATADAAGRPLVVPVCFAVDGDAVYSAVDDKPKRTRELRRLRNIAENPHVALVVDEWSEDWARLRWVMIEGTADVLTGGTEFGRAIDLLALEPEALETADAQLIQKRLARGFEVEEPPLDLRDRNPVAAARGKHHGEVVSRRRYNLPRLQHQDFIAQRLDPFGPGILGGTEFTGRQIDERGAEMLSKVSARPRRRDDGQEEGRLTCVEIRRIG